eukprot:8515199-Pyramimonas_sp.AAC.1
MARGPACILGAPAPLGASPFSNSEVEKLMIAPAQCRVQAPISDPSQAKNFESDCAEASGADECFLT